MSDKDKNGKGKKQTGADIKKRSVSAPASRPEKKRAVHTDLNSVRKNERSIRNLKKILAVLIVVFVGLGIYVTYPKWLPKLEGIFDKPVSTITNDGELEDGNFPLEQDDASVKIYAVKNSLLAAESHTLTFYDENGKERGSYNHAFSTPVARVSGKRVLVFDSGKTDFKIYNKGGEVYSKSAENDILTASLGEDGTAAVLVSSEKYPTTLLIYDSEGKLIYRYNCTHRIMSAAVDPDGSGCYVTTFASENGEVYSQVRRIDFDSSDEKMISEKLNCLALDCVENSAGNITVVGDSAIYTLDGDGKVISSAAYDGDLTAYAMDEDCTAVSLSGTVKNSGKLIIAQADAKSDESYRVISDTEDVSALEITDKRIIMISPTQALAYTFNGTLAAKATLTREYYGCTYINSGLYLISKHGIDKMAFKME